MSLTTVKRKLAENLMQKHIRCNVFRKNKKFKLGNHQRRTKRQSRMDIPETLTSPGNKTQYEDKKKHTKIIQQY